MTKNGFKETKIGQLPKEWKVCKLGEEKYSKLLTGGTPSTKNKDYWNGGIPWMASGEIHQKYIKTVKGRITKEGLNNSAAKYIPIPDLDRLCTGVCSEYDALYQWVRCAYAAAIPGRQWPLQPTCVQYGFYANPTRSRIIPAQWSRRINTTTTACSSISTNTSSSHRSQQYVRRNFQGWML